MKVMTVLGTRPELIRLSVIIAKLDEMGGHIFVHTGQNYEETLNNIFFKEMGIRQPDYFLGIRETSFGQQAGRIIAETEKILLKEKPDALLILGDTNSGLSSIVARRMDIPVFHMEAGNRCYNERVPEEVNRRIIDNATTIWMPYTQRSKENLILEGKARDKVYVIGNPILEVIKKYESEILKNEVLKELNIQKKQFFLVTMHRAENVDVKERLVGILQGLDELAACYRLPIICSLHPRTKDRIEKFGIKTENEYLKFLNPMGLFSFVNLEKNAFCVLSDSGTVQEECCIFNVPNVTLRDVTERPETLECGSSILSGVDPEMIKKAVAIVVHEKNKWPVPEEYLKTNVADTVIKIIFSVCSYLPPKGAGAPSQIQAAG
jgi:UDP-N-acetylglucosamine 2-epimerase (non-hydrolysing)